MNRLVTALTATLALSACQSWPNHGQGGMSEYRPIKELEQVDVRKLAEESQRINRELDILLDFGAGQCVPGQFNQVNNLLIQGTRSLYGGMIADARDLLSQTKNRLFLLRCELLAVRHHTGCFDSKSAKKEPQKHWHTIADLTECPASFGDQSGEFDLINEVLFNLDDAIIPEIYQDSVFKLALLLNANPQASVTLRGHADERGSKGYNQSLSLQRVNAVQQRLVELDVSPQQIRSEYQGKTAPRADERQEGYLQLNRRVEIFVSGIESPSFPFGRQDQ